MTDFPSRPIGKPHPLLPSEGGMRRIIERQRADLAVFRKRDELHEAEHARRTMYLQNKVRRQSAEINRLNKIIDRMIASPPVAERAEEA